MLLILVLINYFQPEKGVPQALGPHLCPGDEEPAHHLQLPVLPPGSWRTGPVGGDGLSAALYQSLPPPVWAGCCQGGRVPLFPQVCADCAGLARALQVARQVHRGQCYSSPGRF